MALGNANSQAQSRGKNKPVIVKRRKEVVAGKGLFTGTKIYTRRRVNDKFTLSVDGAYKAINDRGDNVSISVVGGAVITNGLNRC